VSGVPASFDGMTTTQNETFTDVHDMVVVHRAFRREFTLVPRLVREVAPGDTARAAVLAAHTRMLLKGLHLHHTSEDELLWPKLLGRCPPDAALVERMEAQHEVVAAAIDRLGSALARWEAEARPAVSEEVATALEEMAAALGEHLDEEERHILPIAARHLSQAEWDELGEHGMAEMSRAELPLMFAAALEDATPDERRHMTAKLPLPVRVLFRLVFLRRYERYVSRVRGR
jgi:iron-sulfur cluster repair protein YtfE (RIC family)